MEDSQYKQIEEQALQIVETLNKLKYEIEEYRDAKVETKKNLDSLESLISAVSNAANEIGSAASEIKGSDYVNLHDALMKRSDTLSESCAFLQENVEALPERIDDAFKDQYFNFKNLLSSYKNAQEENEQKLMDRISSMEEIISRIDRNTQKGFGKERG